MEKAGQPLDAAALRARLGPFGERLAVHPLPAGTELVPAERFLAGPFLAAALEQVAERLGTTDRKAAASLWHKWYNAAVMTPALAAMSLLDLALDVAAARVSVAVRDGLPRGIWLPAGEPVGRRWPEQLPGARSELQRGVWQGMIGSHLEPVVEQISRQSGLDRRILWGNAGNLCADVYDRIAAQPDVPPAAAEDRAALLEQPISPQGQYNLLFGTVKYERVDMPGLPDRVRVRRTCCLRHNLPEYTYCYTCPRLSAAERLAVLQGLAQDRRPPNSSA